MTLQLGDRQQVVGALAPLFEVVLQGLGEFVRLFEENLDQLVVLFRCLGQLAVGGLFILQMFFQVGETLFHLFLQGLPGRHIGAGAIDHLHQRADHEVTAFEQVDTGLVGVLLKALGKVYPFFKRAGKRGHRLDFSHVRTAAQGVQGARQVFAEQAAIGTTAAVFNKGRDGREVNLRLVGVDVEQGRLEFDRRVGFGFRGEDRFVNLQQAVALVVFEHQLGRHGLERLARGRGAVVGRIGGLRRGLVGRCLAGKNAVDIQRVLGIVQQAFELNLFTVQLGTVGLEKGLFELFVGDIQRGTVDVLQRLRIGLKVFELVGFGQLTDRRELDDFGDIGDINGKLVGGRFLGLCFLCLLFGC